MHEALVDDIPTTKRFGVKLYQIPDIFNSTCTQGHVLQGRTVIWFAAERRQGMHIRLFIERITDLCIDHSSWMISQLPSK